jgi:integrase
VGTRWHVRFRKRGRAEIVRTYPCDIVSEREVKREVSAFQRRIQLEGWDPWASAPGTEQLTTEEAIRQWCEHLMESDRPKSAVKMYRSMANMTSKLGSFAGTPLHLVTAQMWQKGTLAGGVSPTTQANRAGAVNRLLAWAAKAGHIGDDLSESIRKSIVSKRKERRVSQHISLDAFRALRAALDPDMADFVTVLYYTGMRAGEALAMRGAWVDLVGGWIMVGDSSFRPKSRKNRSVPIPGELVEVLERRMVADRIFRLSYDSVRRRFRSAADAVMPDSGNISLHSLRHTYAINLIMSGFELYEIIQYTGHHSVTMLEANYADWIVRRRPDSFRERFRVL